MSPQKYDIAVIGGGIIGLATALELTREFPRHKVAVLEKERDIALHQTGHNSGVIHTGIYYTPGSQKANFCWSGAKTLRQYCDDRGIEYEMCGKVIVATREPELPVLEDLYQRGTANGVEGLELIEKERLRELESHASGIAALYSPNTGIVDFSKVSAAYSVELQENGGALLTETKVLGIDQRTDGLTVETSKGEVTARHLINCAGLHADRIARTMGVNIDVRIIPFRGEYFLIPPERSHLVRGLVYPVPDPKLPFLGVHFTKRIDGGVEAGPNAVLAFAREGYRKTAFSPADTLDMLTFPGFWRMSTRYWKNGVKEQYRSWIKRSFLRSLRALVPEITMDDLGDSGGGVRAQAVDRDGRLLQDFKIVETRNAIHLLNAPSPGATCSLAIGRHMVDLARKSFDLVT